MKLYRLTASSAMISTLALSSAAIGQSGQFGQTGFSISLGGEVIAGATPPYLPGRAPVDSTLRLLDLTVQFDTLERTRLLNVLTADQGTSYAAGQTVSFRASTNYPAYIERAEIRILDRTRPGRVVVATVPVSANGSVDWVMPAGGPDHLSYTLRVYDSGGRFDETVPRALVREDDAAASGVDIYSAAGEGEDRTAIRNIRVRGGTVVVSAANAIPGDTIEVMGDTVIVDAGGNAVISRILPVGDNVVEVEAYGQRFLRDVHVPQSDWFRTGLIDITVGATEGGPADDDPEFYADGRAAFYVSGYTARGWRIIGSADTTHGPLEDIFSRLDDRDPLRVLDRLREDGSDLYPTYGDDSTWYDSTPTSGNLYLSLETERSRFTWGDFEAGIEGSGLVRTSRDLYGAAFDYRSVGVTGDGAPRFSASVYAAVPDSLPQRDILRGTGGSLYFLSRRDIIGGSSTVRIEEADADTGFVVSSRTLVEGQDFVVDHLQGVLILTRPLQSGAGDGTIISGAGAERILNLVVQYEYVPTTAVGDASFGGRVEGWVNDMVRLGATITSDETGADRQDVVAVDARVALGDSSFIEVEIAQSDGPGFGRASSSDGGLSIVNEMSGASVQSMAFEARLGLQFSDLGLNVDGGLQAWAQVREAGFETLSEGTPTDQEIYGLSLDLGLTESLRFGVDLEDLSRDSGERLTDIEARLSYDLSEQWTVIGAVAYLDRATPGDADLTGTRTDVAVRLSYAADEDLTVYGFLQGTVDVTGGLDENNRAGLGAAYDISERFSISGEVSGGDGGLAANARASWRPGTNNELYLSYSLDPTLGSSTDPWGNDGRLVAGASYRYSERMTSFTEYVFDSPGDQRSLTQVYGVAYTPAPEWSFSAGMEAAAIEDAASGDFDRLGFSLGATWAPSDERSARVRLEYRTEEGDGTDRDRNTWAVTAAYSTQVAEDWRLLANLDAIYSDADASSLSDAEYLRASLGYGYRPIRNERLNILARLTYIHDLSAEDQRFANGLADGPQQRSAVLGIAANYDLTERTTVTGIVGYRMSEVAPRGSSVFTEDTAVLTALRLDYEILNMWDIMAEGRLLQTMETGIDETGAVIGVYRHINDTISLGAGFEWGSVSDDATVIDYESRGLFLNLVGRF